MTSIAMLFQAFGSLAVFLYGMKLMSEGLQTVAGEKLKGLLAKMTSNRFSAVLTGLTVTSVAQSSSVTTVMVVSFVNAGLLTLVQGIGVIMGANIGTTTTAWIVALLGFQFNIASLALPVAAIGFGMQFLHSDRVRQWGNALFGFGLLFLGLHLLKDAIPGIEGSQLQWVTNITGFGFLSMLLFAALGTVLTVILQSSSATMTLTLTLAATGWIPYELAAAMVFGENIGTTVTANLACIGARAVAKRAARAHALFNLIGAAWALMLLKPVLLPLVDMLVPGDPVRALDAAGVSGDGLIAAGIVTAHLAALHSTFNVINTLLMLPFVGHIARIVTRWVPEDKVEMQPTSVTGLGSGALAKAPKILLVQAERDIKQLTEMVQGVFDNALQMLLSPSRIPKLAEDTTRRKERMNVLRIDLTRYLSGAVRNTSDAGMVQKITALMDYIHRFGRIENHCDSLMEIATGISQSTYRFTQQDLENIKALGELVSDTFMHLDRYLAGEGTLDEIETLEQQIDDTHRRMLLAHYERLRSSGDDLTIELWYQNIIAHLEEIGDRCLDVVMGGETIKSPS